MDGVELLEAVNKNPKFHRYDLGQGYGDSYQYDADGGFLYFKTPDLNRLLQRSENALDKKKLVSEEQN
jgi:hypothetical protein